LVLFKHPLAWLVTQAPVRPEPHTYILRKRIFQKHFNHPPSSISICCLQIFCCSYGRAGSSSSSSSSAASSSSPPPHSHLLCVLF
jgi:hypothetical protein